MVLVPPTQPTEGLAPLPARRSCVPDSLSGWRGCNGGAGVQLPCSTQSSRGPLGLDVGRHGNGCAGKHPANSEHAAGGSEGSNVAPTGGRQHGREVMSSNGRTQGDDLRLKGAAVLHGATWADRRIAQASNATHEGRLGCLPSGIASRTGSLWDTTGRRRGSVVGHTACGLEGVSEHLPLEAGGNAGSLRAKHAAVRGRTRREGRCGVQAVRLENMGSTAPALWVGIISSWVGSRIEAGSVGAVASRLHGCGCAGWSSSRGCPASTSDESDHRAVTASRSLLGNCPAGHEPFSSRGAASLRLFRVGPLSVVQYTNNLRGGLQVVQQSQEQYPRIRGHHAARPGASRRSSRLGCGPPAAGPPRAIPPSTC